MEVNRHPFNAPDQEILPSNYVPYNRTIYGKPTAEVLNSYGVNIEASLISTILSEMKSIRDKNVGATIAYDAGGNATVVKMASYDRLGRKEKQWVIYVMQGMPAVQLSYSYNTSDELEKSSFDEWDGSAFVAKAKRFRNYDSKGRLLKIEDENHKIMAAYEYSPNGNVEKKSYYDRGVLVYDKVIVRDVHGRPTEIKYEKNGIVLYTDKLDYETPLAGRISEAERSWKGIPSKGDETRTGKYTYDDDGRLTAVDAPLSGEYGYEGLNGQMSHKKEGDSVIEITYSYNKYRPAGFGINGRSVTATAEYFKYDAAGNVWYDRHAKTAYKLNAAGLPEVAYIQNAYDANLTLTAVNSGTVEDIEALMYMAYDESGGRIWTRVKTAERDDGEVTLSGVGVYSADIKNQVDYTLKRMDLVAGGYRDMKSDKAYFPVTDAQGNVRGYANDNGLVSANDYYAYGGVERIEVDATDDNKKWQGKEYDEATGKLYFGARYYDPFFGMWLSPDPAGQFANPYSYGGDPLNYVDLYGLWSIGFGFTIGWENGGFTAGVGAALDIGSKDFGANLNFGASHNFNDGSNTFSAVAGAAVNIGIVGVGGNLGYSYNTLSGSSLNYGLRGSIYGAGIGVNGANYWNTSGSYMGGTISLEGFYGAFGAEAYAGYEWGYSGMNGREWYRGVRAFGFHVEYAQDGGLNYGGQVYANLITYDANNHPSGYKKETLERVYELQEKCGNSCEVMFTKDGRIEIVVANGDHFSTDLFGANDDDAHSHFPNSSNPNGPSNFDGSSAWERDGIGLLKHYVLVPEKEQIIQYGEIQKPKFMLAGSDRAPIFNTWSIYDNVGWKTDFRVKKSRY